jgi:hypothetical protein
MAASALPPVLLIDRENPLKLLHSVLSESVHSESDQDCLEIAQSIRTILAELSSRMDQALKDEAELKSAIVRLRQRQQAKKVPDDAPPRSTP